jgi:type IV pilus assembly protein PilA
MVVSIIGVLSSIAFPTLHEVRDRAKVAKVASDIKTFATSFAGYAAEMGEYPPDCEYPAPHHLPAGTGLESVIPINAWVEVTPLGGNYNWEGPDTYTYAGVALADPIEPELMELVDAALDDGDLAQGRFRQTPNGRFTYILEE